MTFYGIWIDYRDNAFGGYQSIVLKKVYLCEDEDPKRVERLYSLVAGIYRKGLKDGQIG